MTRKKVTVIIPELTMKTNVTSFRPRLSTKIYIPYQPKVAHESSKKLGIVSPKSAPTALQPSTSQTPNFKNVAAQISSPEPPKYAKQSRNAEHIDWCHLRSKYNKMNKSKSRQQFIAKLTSGMHIKSVVIMDWDDTIFPTTAFQILKRQSSQQDFFQFIDRFYHQHRILRAMVAIIDKLIEDTLKFMAQQIETNNSSICIISNGSDQWLRRCLYGSKTISNLKSMKKLKKALKDKHIDIELLSARSTFKGNAICSVMYKQSAFIKFLEPIKLKHPGHTLCVYCVGDGDDEFRASKLAMKQIFADKDEAFLLCRHKLDVNHKNAKTALQSVSFNVGSFHCWDRSYIIEMILQHDHIQIVYDVFVD